MNIRRTAVLVATGGFALALIGAGVSAQFTASATATDTISVGSFNLQIVQPTTPGAVITADANGYSVAFTAQTIISSASGSSSFTFSLKDAGTIPAAVAVTSVVSGNTNFTAMPIAPFALAAGGTTVVTAGLNWSALTNNDLGSSATVTYTITATA